MINVTVVAQDLTIRAARVHRGLACPVGNGENGAHRDLKSELTPCLISDEYNVRILS